MFYKKYRLLLLWLLTCMFIIKSTENNILLLPEENSHIAYISGWAPELIPLLAQELEKNNYKVITAADFNYINADCVITININAIIANRIDSYNRLTNKKIKLYSIMLEPPHVDWQSYNLLFYNKHDLIFTLDDSFANFPYFKKYIKINFPQQNLNLIPSPIPFNQKKLLTIVNSYKKGCEYSPTFPYDLYRERLNLINYFNGKPHLFDFYGQRWENSYYKYYLTYGGPIENKISTLHKYKFVVCFENSSVTPGYITEKIFDAFIAGAVPVYWGAPNVTDYIPEDCFIDMRKYNNYVQLQEKLEGIEEKEYNLYLNAIAHFLNSPQGKTFLNSEVVHLITNNILQNIKE